MKLHDISQSPNDPAFVADPYAFYQRARQVGEIVYWREYAMPCALSYRVVTAILKDRRFARVPPDGWPSPPQHAVSFAQAEQHSLLNLEPPDHTRLRRAVLQAFTSGRVASLRPQISALCDRLIDAFPRNEPFDVLQTYAKHVPVIVIAKLLGVDTARCGDLLDWSHAMVRMYLPNPEYATAVAANAASRTFLSFLNEVFEERAAAPRDDLVSALLRQEASGALSRAENLSSCILLLNAGHEATVHALGNAVATLDETHNALELTRPSKIEATVEECLRVDPPLHMFTRWAHTTIDIEGVRIAKGEQIALMLGAANHDPAVYDAPATFRPGRNQPTLTTFGAGLHFCLGAPLARLEMQIALETLYRRLPGLRVARPPRHADTYHFRGYKQLWVTA